LSRDLAKQRPPDLTLVPPELWPPPRPGAPRPLKCWQSRKYLVQLFEVEGNSQATYRMTICRVTLNIDGRFDDGLSWEDLQDVKREVGFGDSYAVEVFPRDRDIVNVANMRHLWICENPPDIGWLSTP
jgi:hypothetical protein